MMNMIKRVSLVALLLTVGTGSVIPQAQAQIFRPNNGNYNRGNDLRNQFQDYLNRVDQEASNFAGNLDRDLDRSRLNDRNSEDQINQLAKDIRQYARTAKNDFARQQPVRSDVQQLINATNRMDTILRRTRISLSGNTQRNWSDLRSDVNQMSGLADQANRYGGYNGGGYNNGNYNNGNYNNGGGYGWWR